MRTAQEHLEWCIGRAMEYYNQGDMTGALASFLSDVGKHDGTAHIQSNPASFMILQANLNRGAREYEEAMRGFAIIEQPASAG